MIVRAGDLRPDGLEIDDSLPVGPLGYEGGLEMDLSDAGLKARILPSNGGLSCSGRVKATVQVPCSRCLESYEFPVDREFELVYRPGPPHGGDREVKISHDDLNVGYLGPEGDLDLSVLAAEQIYLELPMKPLCKSDCRGLCTGCGVDLNKEGCRCAPADPAEMK